jgi:hypothetical protein
MELSEKGNAAVDAFLKAGGDAIMSKALEDVIEGLIEELSFAYGQPKDVIQGALIVALGRSSVVEIIKEQLDPVFL